MRSHYGLRTAALALLVIFLSVPVYAGPREDVAAAHARGDYATEARLLRSMAEAGDAAAQGLLGLMYNDGQGVAQDYVEAVRWFRKAAEQGYAEAQFLLGGMYLQGKGVPQDYYQAYVWYTRAAPLNEGAAKMRDLLQKHMTPAQIAEAKRLSTEITQEEAEQVFKRGLEMINSCVMDFMLVEVGKATTSKQFESIIQERCGPQQRYVVLVMTQRGGKPGDPVEVANMQKAIDGMRQKIVVNYAQMRRTLHPRASKGQPCQSSEYRCAIQND
jgi:TPR repeat protein